MFRLDGKVALITGAAGGLGDKIARTLHAQGAIVALTDMRAEPMEKPQRTAMRRIRFSPTMAARLSKVRSLRDTLRIRSMSSTAHSTTTED